MGEMGRMRGSHIVRGGNSSEATIICHKLCGALRRSRVETAPLHPPSMNSVSSFSKLTISPLEAFASSVVGFMTVGKQHEACTALRMSTCGEVRWLSSRAPREPSPPLREPMEMLMLATRPVRSNASWHGARGGRGREEKVERKKEGELARPELAR